MFGYVHNISHVVPGEGPPLARLNLQAVLAIFLQSLRHLPAHYLLTNMEKFELIRAVCTRGIGARSPN
jgi:hypothetical protein